MQGPWPRITALWLIGILAAAQLAKIATLAPVLRQAFGLSLPAIGLLISLLEVGGGLLGFAAGLALGRIGARRSLLAGMAVLAAAGTGEAFASGAAMLFAARAIEGIGYLLVVIAAPTLIAATADDGQRATALALWSSFVPVGVACGGAITGLATGALGVHGTMMLWSLLSVCGLLVALRLPIATMESAVRISLPRAGAWLSTLAFGCYTLFICALTMLLPTFLTERNLVSVKAAGLLTGLASLGALPGPVLVIAIIGRVRLDGRRTLVLVIPTLLATALLAPALFRFAGATTSDLVASTGLAGLIVMVSGIAPPLVFARLPTLAGARGRGDARIAAANGLITQFGAGGALIGPPLGGVIVSRWGWDALGQAIAILALAMLAMLLLSERLAAGATRRARQQPA